MESDLNTATLIGTLVTAAVGEENLYKKLRLTNTILHSLEDSQMEGLELKEYHDKLKELILDVEFLRKLKFNATIKENPMSAIEYLGKDYIGGDSNFNYDEGFEEFLAKVKYDTEIVLGKVVKKLSEGKEGINFGGTEI